MFDMANILQNKRKPIFWLHTANTRINDKNASSATNLILENEYLLSHISVIIDHHEME
jgi:hypothetical protein